RQARSSGRAAIRLPRSITSRACRSRTAACTSGRTTARCTPSGSFVQPPRSDGGDDMRRITGAAILSASAVATAAWLHAQGREWTTAAFDAQRTGWVRTDARLTRDAVQKGEFQFLWKATFENDARQLNSLTPPILLDRLIGYRGFKALGFVGGSSHRVFAIDTDLARPYWTTHLNYSAATGAQPPPPWAFPGGWI